MNNIIVVFVVVIFSTCASAQDYKIGNWNVIKSIPDIQIARTDADDSSAGIFCTLSSATCNAYVTIDSSCDDGDKYPFLLNTPTGAFASKATCKHLSDLKILVIDEFSEMISAFESGGEIGFATPMMNGQFKVVRFSTVGATAAIKVVRTLPSEPSPRAKPASKKTEFL